MQTLLLKSHMSV